nr:hypothetical protein [Bacillus licheniformis]
MPCPCGGGLKYKKSLRQSRGSVSGCRGARIETNPERRHGIRFYGT